MTYKKSLISILVLIIISSFISGCVYLRFLQVKRQLNDFNKHFEVNDQKKLSIKFLKPVLIPSDIVWLMATEPINKEIKSEIQVWHFMFEKRYRVRKNEPGNYDIPVQVYFTKDKMTELVLPEKFAEYFSKSLFQKLLSSLGEAKVSKMKKKVGSEFKSDEKTEIPKIKDIVNTLGKPYSKGISGEEIIYIYKYDIKSPDPKKNPKLKIIYRFDKTTTLIRRLEGNVRGIKLMMDFTKFDKEN